MSSGITPREMLARPVAFPTVSSRSNLDRSPSSKAGWPASASPRSRVPDPTGDKTAPGSIAQARQPDEFISADPLDAGTEFIRRLIRRLAA